MQEFFILGLKMHRGKRNSTGVSATDSRTLRERLIIETEGDGPEHGPRRAKDNSQRLTYGAEFYPSPAGLH